MILKPSMYDDIQLNDDFIPIKLGGHKGIIKNVEEYTSDFSGNTSLKVYVDTDKDDIQPNYFTEQYKNDTRPDKKWSNSAIKFVSLKDEENCVRMLKGFITSVESSNNNFKYNWDKDITQLKNKKVGLVFGLEEYENQDGELKTITKLNSFRSINKIDNIKIPKVKLLNGTFVEYEDYKEKKQTKSDKDLNIESLEITASDLPF